MNKNQSGMETIVDCIIQAIDNKIRDLYCDKEGTIIGEKDNMYIVAINSYEYKVKNGTNIIFKNGDKCLVHFINGNQQRKLIIAKL